MAIFSIPRWDGGRKLVGWAICIIWFLAIFTPWCMAGIYAVLTPMLSRASYRQTRTQIFILHR